MQSNSHSFKMQKSNTNKFSKWDDSDNNLYRGKLKELNWKEERRNPVKRNWG